MRARRRTAAALATTLAVLCLAPGPAAADPVPGPPGAPCTLSTADEPSRDSDFTTALLSGGPVTGDGTLVCTLRSDWRHDAPAITGRSSAGAGFVVLTPTVVTFAGVYENLHVCTSFAVADGPLLYWNGHAGYWTTDPSALCEPWLRILSHGGGGTVSPASPKQPVYPAATLEITVLGPQRTFSLTAANPPADQWECTWSGGAVTCTPPAPADGFYNVCGTVTVQVRNNGPGQVEGRTACAWGRQARAKAGPPTVANANAAAPYAAFGWTCAADPELLTVAWTVTCHVAA